MTTILESFFSKARKECVPLVTTIEITQGCNYKCHHCYNFDRTKEMPKEISENQLTPQEIFSIIDQVAAEGALYLNFTGGETLLHPHLDDFIRRAKSHHLEVRLKTNGSLLTAERCSKLDAAGLAGMDISLYGASEESYRKLTGKEGMFQRACSGIEYAVRAGFDVSVSVILHRYNLDEIKAMIDFCEGLKVQYNFSSEITERYDSTTGSKNFEITAEQFAEQLYGEYSYIFMAMNPHKALQCSCAKTVCGITSTGVVYPCIGAPIPSGNIREKSFSEVWKDSPEFQKIRSYKQEDFKSCMSCEHIEFCNRSSGAIYANTKEYTGCDESTLTQARIRHEFFLAGAKP